MSDGATGDGGGDAEALLAEGEQALVRGDSAAAYQLLERASQADIDRTHLHRLASAFAMAARLQNRHADVLAWIDGAIPPDGDAQQRAALLRARVAVCRQLDLN